MKPKVLVLSGYGINCERETKFAFEYAGAQAEIIHINDLINKEKNLEDFHILAVPGGFSYGDDTGSGNALANKIRLNLWEELMGFIGSGKLIIGICNGFQVLTNLGLLPALNKNYGERKAALTFNNSTRYECRWINLKQNSNKCVFTKNISSLKCPIAHGEGKFFTDYETLEELKKKDQIVFSYTRPSGNPANGEFPFNPNGSLLDIAGICNETGRIFGMMPHPERAIFMGNFPDFQILKEKAKREGKEIPEYYEPAVNVFQNAVNYVNENLLGNEKVELSQIEKYRKVQDIARETMNHLSSYIKEGVSEKDIVNEAIRFMNSKGISSFWYHGVGALVLVGERTRLSISGRDYKPSDIKVKKNDLVTVDLGPELDSCWSDFARSFVVSNGKVIDYPDFNSPIEVEDMFKGINIEEKLHKKLKEVAKPEMTFEELYFIINKEIENLDYKNLDFKRNLGHSIEKDKKNRIYIEQGCNKRLSDVAFFTFEPHIQKDNGVYGYKMEDIYYFEDNNLKKLGEEDKGITYEDAGVNIELGEDVSKILYNAAKQTWINRKGKLGELIVPFDDFSGVRAIDVSNLPSGTLMNIGFDGVGTKMELAERMNDHTTIAYDLFAMVCDDAVVRGAEPVLVGSILDVNTLGKEGENYIEQVKQLAKGYIEAAKAANVAIVNGEVAELGDRIQGFGPFNYNWGAGVVWFATKNRLFTGREIKPGDSIVSFKEEGFRSNGLSLVRKVFQKVYGDDWHKKELNGISLGKLALTPSKIYSKTIINAHGGIDTQKRAEIHAVSHITGGGIPSKLGRVLKTNEFGAELYDLFEPSEVMLHCQKVGNINDREAYSTWNMGNGMLVITPEPEKIIQIAQEDGVQAKIAGKITLEKGIKIKNKGNIRDEEILSFSTILV